MKEKDPTTGRWKTFRPVPSIGQRIGRLTIASTPQRFGRCVKLLCRCDCGVERYFIMDGIQSGTTKSCGCYKRDSAAMTHTVHGDNTGRKRTPELEAWSSMLKRCYNPKATHYDRYGGRGITVCDQWRHSYLTFLKDMGRRPTPKHTIERKDNDGNYTPENCKWATWLEQNNNRKSNRRVAFNGRNLTFAEWSREVGIGQLTIGDRIRNGWTPERALMQPTHP